MLLDNTLVVASLFIYLSLSLVKKWPISPFANVSESKHQNTIIITLKDYKYIMFKIIII
jgi:hypothetical protein